MSREISSQPEMRVTEAELSERQVATAQQLAELVCKTDFELCDGVKNRDDLASTVLIERFDRFIVQCAYTEMSRRRNLNAIDADDLIQEGRLALLHAADRAEARQNSKFLSYAGEFIRQRMRRHIGDMASTVRIPVHIGNKVRLTHAINSKRMNEQRRILDEEQMAELLDIPVGPASYRTGVQTTTGDILQADLVSNHMGSIDTGYSPGQDYSLGNDYILDERSSLKNVSGETQPHPDPYEQTVQIKLHQDMEILLTTLTERERKIIEHRFGLNGEDPKSLYDVGEEFGLHHERIRQIEARALTYLRHSNRSDKIRTYLD